MQNTVTNLGASIGTALSGAILIAVLTTTFLGSVAANPAIPKELSHPGAGRAVRRHPFRERRRPQGEPGESGRPSGDSECHRRGERPEPDQRAAGRAGRARPPGPGRLGSHQPAPHGATRGRGRTPKSSSRNRPETIPRRLRSDPPERDAAPGPLAAGGTGHPVIETAPGPPHRDRELEDEQVEDADVRGLPAPGALHGEGAPLVQRGCPTSSPGCPARGGRPSRAHACRRAAPPWSRAARLGLPRRRHPEQGPLAQRIRRFVAPRGGHVAQAVCIAS